MFETVKRIFAIPELRQKIFFTITLLAIYRVGGFIPVPGINGEIAISFFRHATGGAGEGKELPGGSAAH